MAINFGTVTRALGLPEMGISEMLGGNTDSLNSGPSPESIKKFNDIINNNKSRYYDTKSYNDYSNLYKSTPTPTNTFKTDSGSSGGGGEDPVEKARRLEVERQKKEAEERKRALKQARSAYNPFFEDLARQEAEIPGIEQNYLNTLNTGYQNQQDVIARGQQAGLDQANASTGVIKQNQATSLRDLASNLSNAVNAFGQRLGQAGAGDSSAANMANYAYSKLANRNTADVMAQVRNQLAEVETAKQNIVRDAQDKLSQLSTWKANETLVIQNAIRDMRNKINQYRVEGKMSMAESDVAMIREGFSRAMERLQQINDLEVTTAMDIKQRAADALAQANEYSLNIQNQGNINPADITQAPIDSGSISSGGTSSNLIPITITDEKEQSLADLLHPLGSYDPYETL